MPDSTITFAKEVWDLIKYLIVATLGFFGWNLKRQVSRIDKLEETTVHESQLNKTIDTFNDSIKDGFKDIKDDMNVMHTQTRLDIREIHKRIDGIVNK